MRLSLSSASLYLWPLRSLFRVAAETGYEGIELVMAPEVWARGTTHVRGLSHAYCLPVLSVHQAMLPISPSGNGPARMLDAARAALELGCPVVVIHDPFAQRWDDPGARRWRSALLRCQDLLAGGEARLALENPGWYHRRDAQNLFAQPMELLSFVRQNDLELTYDTCHAGSAESGVCETWEALRTRVVNVHISDLKPGSPALGLDTLRTLLFHHQMPGEGSLPLRSFVAQLAEDGYAGPLTLELSPTALRAWAPSELRRRLAQAAEYVRGAAAHAPENASSHP